MTPIKNPTVLGGVGRCVRARILAHILALVTRYLSPTFHPKNDCKEFCPRVNTLRFVTPFLPTSQVALAAHSSA